MSRRGKRDAEQRVELLSAYIDHQLSAEERAYVEERLRADPAWRSELETLRRTVTLVRELPTVTVPRNFLLTPRMVRPQEARPARRPRLARAAPLLTAATTLVSLLLVVVLAADLVLVGGTARVSAPEQPAAPEIAMEQAPAEEKAADEGPAGTLVVEHEAEEEAAEEMAPAEAPGEEETPLFQVEGTPGIGGGGEPPTASLEAATLITEERTAMVIASPTPETLGEETTPSPAPSPKLPLPQITEAPPASPPSEVRETVQPVSWLTLEVALGATAAILALLTLWAWRLRRRTDR